jgi:hypothetical protein
VKLRPSLNTRKRIHALLPKAITLFVIVAVIGIPLHGLAHAGHIPEAFKHVQAVGIFGLLATFGLSFWLD